jgi:hypothetical protein
MCLGKVLRRGTALSLTDIIAGTYIYIFELPL